MTPQDTDTLMSDHEDASRLRRRGWRVIPPDHSGMHPCLGDRCLTLIESHHRYCSFCRKTRRAAA